MRGTNLYEGRYVSIVATVPVNMNIRCSILCRLFFLSIQTGSGTHSVCSLVGTKGSFSRSKAAVA